MKDYSEAWPTLKKSFSLFLPPPQLTASEWADQYRVLGDTSAEPGKWRTSRAPYLKEPMDVLYTEDVSDVTCVFASQTGKSELILNDLGRRIHLSPAPILVVLPSIEMGEGWSEERFAPMLANVKELQGVVAVAKSRDSRNTKRHKKFRGGFLTITGANSASSLSMRAIRDLRCDEVDRFPASASGAAGIKEGDPILLAQARTSTFHDATIIKVSSPTDEDTSRILASYKESDQRKYFVPCPFCKEMQILDWQNMHWDDKKYTATTHYVCPHCKKHMYEGHKSKMLAAGEWRKTAKLESKKAGFWLSALYSPWVTWSQLAIQYDEAKRSRKEEQMKVFINTRLAEGYKENYETFDYHSLLARRETYEYQVPNGVLILTAGVDTQDDRLEIQTVGYGHDDELWAIDYKVIWGNPAKKEIWEELDAYLKSSFKGSNKKHFGISCTCIDSRGHYNSKVWEFCSTRKHRHIFAIHGIGGANKAIVGQPKRPKTGRMRRHCMVFPVGTYEAKTAIYSYLKLTTPGACYYHFPKKEMFGEEYFKQLTSEQKKTVYRHGYATKEFFLPEGKRNEGLDTMVYALAALNILKPNFALLESRIFQNMDAEDDEQSFENIDNMKKIEGATQYDNKTPERSEYVEPQRQYFKKRGRNLLLQS